MQIHNVALIGANGHLGPFMLQALLESNLFSVTVLSRATSLSTYPSEVKIAIVGDELPHEDLVSALQGQDALLITFSGYQADQALALIDAAIEAGVKLIIPPDFGSCDSSDPRPVELIPPYSRKVQVRQYLQSHEDQVAWISIVTGHFFDWGLESGLMAVDLKKRRIRIFDNGDVSFSATTLPSIGLATVKVLQHADELKNRLVYVQSISATQIQLKEALEEVTGSPFEVEQVSSDDWIAKQKTLLREKGMDHEVIEELVTVAGILYADWTEKGTFSNSLLGMPEDNLVDLLRRLRVH